MSTGGAIKGALGGAGTGASMGSVLGPWGAVGGGLIGGVLGALSGGLDDSEERRKKLIEAYRNGGSSFRENQAQLISNLEQSAAGRGPSAVDAQLKAAQGRVGTQMASAAAGGRGAGGVNMQAAMNGAAQANAQMGSAAVGQRIDEQQRARELLGLNITQARQLDEARQAAAFQAEMGAVGAPTQGDQLLSSGMAAGNQALSMYAQDKARREWLARAGKPSPRQADAADQAAQGVASIGNWTGGMF